jgi:rhamnose transport system ATP-binding protein
MACVEMVGVAKAYGGVPALKGVDFSVGAGTVHALLGENGAGKSTLMKVLGGVIRPDRGTVRLDDKIRNFASPRQALDAGVTTVPQEPSLCPDLSVCDNLFLSRAKRTRTGLLDWRVMRDEARAIFAELGVDMPIEKRVGQLSKARAQFVQIARALLTKPRVMIMDEPSAALTDADVERLFAIVERLRANGVAVVYISHRLDEIFRITDEITVMRDGARVGSGRTKDVDQAWIIRHMVGRASHSLYHRTPHPPGDVVLETRGISREGAFRDVSLSVRAGEIVGMAGLVGAGRSDLAEALLGLKPSQGAILLNGTPLNGSVGERIVRGVALVPEDRSRQGLVLSFSLRQNTTLASLAAVSSRGFISSAREQHAASGAIASLRVRPESPGLPAASFSGGNQQKIVLGKWLATGPKLLILDEPTQGVDVGAKVEIHALIDRLAAQGLAILMISSDLQELLGMSDRLVVMYRGRLVAEYPKGAPAETVMKAASGLSGGAHGE